MSLVIHECPVCADTNKVTTEGDDLPSRTKTICSKCTDGHPYKITMLYETAEKTLMPCYTSFVSTTDPKEACEFLKGNPLTAGFSVQYVYNPEKKLVVSVVKKGKIGTKICKALIELGYTEFLYSWAFATKRFMTSEGEIIELVGKLDLIHHDDIMPWAKTFNHV